MKSLSFRVLSIAHPYFERREVKTRGIILLSTDKGLCGPLNSNLMRKVVDEVKGDAKFFTVGRKASQFVSALQARLGGRLHGL